MMLACLVFVKLKKGPGSVDVLGECLGLLHIVVVLFFCYLHFITIFS